MAKRPASKEIITDFQFPLEGLDETRAYLRQRPGTTASAQNVRGFDPVTDRARGGQRRGFAAYFPAIDPVTVAGFPIQDINHLVTNNPASPALILGDFVYGRLLAAGFSVGTSAGVNTFTAGAVAGFQMSCSCWDSSGNVYVAETNVTTGAVNVYSYDRAGTLRWANTATGIVVATGSLRKVCGIVVIGTVLYLATVFTAAPVGRIHQLATSSGTVTLGWVTTSTSASFSNLIFSTAAVSCLAAIGNILGVECFGAATNLQGFMIIDTTLSPALNAPIYLAYGGTAAANKSCVVSDEISTFYTIANISTNQVKAVSSSGILVWSSTAAGTPTGLCFDYSTGFLLACTTVGPSVRQLKTADGTLGTSGSPNAFTSYNWIDSDDNGNLTLWRDANASLDVVGSTTTYSLRWGPTTFANTTHSGSSVNKGVKNQPPTSSARAIRLLLVSNGTCRRFDVNQTTSITNGSSFSPTAKVIFSAQNGINMFYVDGVTYQYYKSTTDAITTWSPASGTMPVDQNNGKCRLIAAWRGRIVMAGLILDPNNYFMSASGNSFDWNYSPATPTATQAFAGTNADVGMPGDFINCLIPYNDDTFIFGCDSSIWQMTGDPANGGSLDVISHKLGMAWGRPFAIDPYGQIYFFSPKAGLWKMTPGSLPVPISQQIMLRLKSINLNNFLIRMAWDMTNQGLAVWITPYDPTVATTNYFWEERTNAWWPDVYANKLHNPLSVHEFDGDDPNDRTIMIGGRNGKVHIMNNTTATDDGTTISSFVVLGPIMTKQLDDIILKDLQTILGESSATVTYSVYTGGTAEEALASTAIASGTWGAGRNGVTYIRRAGTAIYVKITASSAWALERIQARYEPQGKVRRRMA